MRRLRNPACCVRRSTSAQRWPWLRQVSKHLIKSRSDSHGTRQAVPSVVRLHCQPRPQYWFCGRPSNRHFAFSARLRGSPGPASILASCSISSTVASGSRGSSRIFSAMEWNTTPLRRSTPTWNTKSPAIEGGVAQEDRLLDRAFRRYTGGIGAANRVANRVGQAVPGEIGASRLSHRRAGDRPEQHERRILMSTVALVGVP